MTGSGIYGTLVEVSEATVLLQVAPGVEMKIARRAIASQVVDPSAAETDETGKTDDEGSDA
jgi:preprotein translocase subunit YajC